MDRKLSRSEYEKQIASTRNKRMQWWRAARFGMFIHYGLYSQAGRHEWMMAHENIPITEYKKLADTFRPKLGAPKEWAAQAKKSGMKYIVMTTRHHEGFSLWDSKANFYNSINYGPKRDIVREFVDACREYELGIGFYSSLMDWNHTDGWRCAFDTKARQRFTQYILDLNTELLTQYGKIDILWYDVPEPMKSWEGWDSLELNQHMRSLQPDIIINDRSQLPEDFGTPEENLVPSERDWEACMTFNGISWGYVDSKQATAYSCNAQRIIKMLCACTGGSGNLLLNIGPTPDGSIPEEAIEPLKTVGNWLNENGAAVYGHNKIKNIESWSKRVYGGNGITGATSDGKSVYLWNWIWPSDGEMGIGGYLTAPNAVRLLKDGTPLEFEHKGHRILLKNLPKTSPDLHAGITVIELEFEERPQFLFASYYPQLHEGEDITDNNRL